MKCPKCQASMMHEKFTNHSEDSVSFAAYGWHCVFCGMVLDPVILKNREMVGAGGKKR